MVSSTLTLESPVREIFAESCTLNDFWAIHNLKKPKLSTCGAVFIPVLGKLSFKQDKIHHFGVNKY
jgi:hypothetical protein